MKQIIATNKAPSALGPYSQANVTGNLVFTAGQIGLDPATGNIVAGGIEAETRQVLTNLKNILEAAGTNMDNVLKTTVYLSDMGNFAAMNGVYKEFFSEGKYPARSAVEVGPMAKNAMVEIDAIAVKD